MKNCEKYGFRGKLLWKIHSVGEIEIECGLYGLFNYGLTTLERHLRVFMHIEGCECIRDFSFEPELLFVRVEELCVQKQRAKLQQPPCHTAPASVGLLDDIIEDDREYEQELKPVYQKDNSHDFVSY